MLTEPLTIREASVVTGVPVAAVNRAIDDRKFSFGVLRGARERRLTWKGVVALAVESELENAVTPKNREACARQFEDWCKQTVTASAWEPFLEYLKVWQQDSAITAHRHDLIIHLGAVTLCVEFKPIANRLTENRRKVDEALSLIVEDPDTQAGAPTFRGTRVLVWPIAQALENGSPQDELLEDYPALTPAMLEAARLYAAIRPPRGRPKVQKSGQPKSVRRYPAK